MHHDIRLTVHAVFFPLLLLDPPLPLREAFCIGFPEVLRSCNLRMVLQAVIVRDITQSLANGSAEPCKVRELGTGKCSPTSEEPNLAWLGVQI